jgi:hypothetical protein
MSLPVSIPYVFGPMRGIVPVSYFDVDFNVLAQAINGINAGTNPLTNVSVTGGTWAGTRIGVAYGGTGLATTPTNGQVLIGNGTGYALSTLTGGSGVTVTNGSGTITIATTSTGTVSSVDVSGGTTGLTTTGGPITTSGTITLTGTLAVANGGTGVTTSTGTGSTVRSTSPTLVTPILGTPTSVTLTNATGLPLTTGVTGTLPATNGGTGLSTYATGDILYASGINTLSKLSASTNGYVLTLAAGVPTWAAGGGGITVDTTAISGGTSGRVLYDNAGTVGEKPVTGTGSVVLATSPTLVAPALGTPTSAVLTNATGLPVGGISATGTPSITTYLRGDGSWSTVSGSGTVTSVSFTGGIITVATATTTPALTVAGTSGGIPYFSSASTWATSAALAANAIVIGGGAGAAPATTTTGTGIIAALGINVGTAGSVVVNGGALGTPSSGTLTSATGLPLTTGVTGILPTANGGTNLSTFTAANNAIYSTSASVLTAGTLPIAAGGTNATTAATALSNLGGVTTGKAIAMAIVFGG